MRTRLIPPGVRIGLLGAGAIAVIVVFLTVGVTGSWDFAIPFRSRKVAAMVVVAFAIGISTVLFQTVTNNRILTPSIMGFDSLYLLIQTTAVFVFGVSAFSSADPRLTWLVEVAAMVILAVALFRWLFARARRSVHVLILVGIIFGVLFRSLSSFMQRILDPTAFAVLQDSFFASFNAVDLELLLLSAVIVGVASILAWRMRRVLDVVGLGDSHAIGLGVDHRRVVTAALVMVAVLVAVSTALVGPITFFGLLVANLAYHLTRSARHALTLPATVLLGVICLVGGQFILEQLLGFGTVLGVVIEFVGGIVFILLLMKRGVR